MGGTVAAPRGEVSETASGGGHGTASGQRTHPQLWDRIKEKWHRGKKGGVAGKWNARKAQLAVAEYKAESRRRYGDSGYRAPKPADHAARNSLAKWTAEDWDYAGKPGKSRYLPRAVSERLTPAQKRRENTLKGAKKGRNVPYTAATAAAMRAEELRSPGPRGLRPRRAAGVGRLAGRKN